LRYYFSLVGAEGAGCGSVGVFEDFVEDAPVAEEAGCVGGELDARADLGSKCYYRKKFLR
jgi:hypothetical protein